jgi:putative lipoprotein
VADLAARSASDWSRFLMEMLPAVAGCLEKTPGAGPYVTKAWLMNRGLIGVRTRNVTAGWFDCVAQIDGHVIERFEPVTAEVGPVPGEAAVVFTPAGGTPLSGTCWQHERVLDRDGNLLGWLSANNCSNARG